MKFVLFSDIHQRRPYFVVCGHIPENWHQMDRIDDIPAINAGLFGSGGCLPPPHSAFGGCGLPHGQMAENLKAPVNACQKLPDPSII